MALKTAAETLAVASGATAMARRLHRGRAIVLAYHNVVPDADAGRGQATLHLPVSRFRGQLDRLAATHRIVALDRLLDGSAWDRGSRRPLAALTFDDAYAGALVVGLPQVTARELPATVFVSPALLGGRCFWWDLLADRRQGVLPGGLRRWALDEMAGDHRRILTSPDVEAADSSELPDSLKSATEEELFDAETREGVTVASHGWSHRNMARLPDEALDYELERPLEWLSARLDGFLPVLSYPYGSSSTRVRERARRARYRAALEISGGWWSPGPESLLALPRINVPAGVSLRGFEILTSGLRSPG